MDLSIRHIFRQPFVIITVTIMFAINGTPPSQCFDILAIAMLFVYYFICCALKRFFKTSVNKVYCY